MSDQTGVVAVLERMRRQADYGRCMDSNFTAKMLIQQIDEDRAALNAVAELIAATNKVNNLYPLHWDRVDGAAVVFPDRVPEFETAFSELSAALQACKGGA